MIINGVKNKYFGINAFNYRTMAKNLTWCLKRTFVLANRVKIYQQHLAQVKTNNFGIQSRYIANPRENHINIDYDEPKKFSEFADELRQNSSAAITTLMKILSVTKANARKAINDYPDFKKLPKKIIYVNFLCLREAGFYKSTIKDNKYLLTDDTETLKRKLSIVQKIDVDINDAAPLFQLPAADLANFFRLMKMEASYLPVNNRIIYLSEKLQCDIATICNLMSYNPLIMKLPAPKLLTTTEYLLDVGMKPEHILSDLQIYNYNIDTIKEKIEKALKIGTLPLRPWVVRCQNDVWKKMEEKQAARESILKPGQSVVEFIRDKFDCDMEQVNYVVNKNPKLLALNMKKLSTMLTFLQSEGYKIEDIQRAPSAVCRSLSTIVQRYTAWKKAFNKKPALFVFIISNENFEKLLKTSRSTDVDENPS